MQTNSKRKGEPDVKIVFWTHRKMSCGKQTYLFQIEAGNLRTLSKIKKQIGGTVSGEGYNPQTKSTILILRREFESSLQFKKFKEQFSFKFEKVKN